jgi:beta-galactosidase
MLQFIKFKMGILTLSALLNMLKISVNGYKLRYERKVTMRQFKSILTILLLISVAVLGLIIFQLNSVTVSGERTSQTLDTGWQFFKGPQPDAYKADFNDIEWQSVTIPHTWNTDVVKNQKDSKHYKGDGWYRLQLPVTNDMKEKRLFLRFKGALAVADVFVNGDKVGQHVGGFTAFCYEITDHIKWDQTNILAVKVNNEDNTAMIPANERLFTLFGGIYRPVELLVMNPTCITPLDYASSGVYILPDNVTDQKADLTITTKLSNALDKTVPLSVNVRIVDAAGSVVAKASGTVQAEPGTTVPLVQKLSVNSPHLWNGLKDPYLYEAKIEVVRDNKIVDSITQPLGLRYFHVDANKGFFLNGEHYDMHGTCRHQEWEHEGSALTDVHHRKDIEYILEMGCTTLRLAHYPQSATMYSLCDKNGLIIWAEIPVVQGTDMSKPGALPNARQQLVEMIRQNYNHPSIFFWGLYNECVTPVEMVQEMYDIAKKEDPGRLTVAASDKRLSEKHHLTDVICWNKYPMWYENKNFMLDEWITKIHTENPDLKIGISEYGAGACIDQHQLPPEKPNPSNGRFFPEEYQSLLHETVYPQLDGCSFLWGTYLWNMFDFSWPGVTRGSRINVNQKGLITYDRKVKKDSFYYYKANWSQEPVLYITSRRFAERTDAITDIKVYSNCEKIELTLNGKKYPASKGAYGVYVWPKMELVEGKNEVQVSAVKDGKSISDACAWNLTPTVSVSN